MKKVKMFVLCAVMVGVLFVTGCEKVSEGKYKAGTYFGSAEDTYGGTSNQATAAVYVDENGKIASVLIDTTYKSGEKITTKKALGEDYNMKKYSSATYEWYEQMNFLEKKIVEEQGLEFINWTDTEKSTTDSVSGVTIKINAVYAAVENALKQAK